MNESCFHAWFGMSRQALVSRLRALADDLENLNEYDSGKAQPSVVINDWALAKRAVPCLIGISKGHPKIEDGHALFSSSLFYLNEDHGIARSFSRWYRLGTRVDADLWSKKCAGKS